MSITKLMQDIDEDFKKRYGAFELSDNIGAGDQERFLTFLHSAQTRLLEGVVKEIENQKTEMKETHICGFNDGKQNCDCYLKALSDIIRKLKQDEK